MLKNVKGNLLQWLRGFHFAVQEGGVSRAAERMGMDQSAVSHHIRNLEKLLNVSLFQRNSKEMRLTDAGQRLFHKSIPLFQHIQGIMEEVGREPGQLKGLVSIATTHAVAKHFLTGIILRFRQEYPEVRFSISGGLYGPIMEKIQKAEVDFGIAPLLAFPDNIVGVPLFASQLVVISPKGNPFGLPPKPVLEDLPRFPFISFSPMGTVESFLQPLLQEKSIEFNRVIVANNYALLLHYVVNGMGITVLDAFTVEGIEDQVDIRLLEGVPLRGYGLIARTDKYVSSQAFEFRTRVLRSTFPKGCGPFPPKVRPGQ